MIRRPLSALALAASALLAGCFSSGDDDHAVPADPLSAVPPAVATSPQAAVDYQKQLTAMPSDSREPIELGDLTLATSETDEPKAVE